jgi:hypothetical protein
MSKQHYLIAVLSATVIFGVSNLARAQYIIGNWESGSADGWIDWSNNSGAGLPITDVSYASKYSFSSTTGVTLGSSSLHLSHAGYQQNLAKKLEYTTGDVAAFFANDTFQIDVTYPAQTAVSGYQQIYQLALNASGFGFNNFPGTVNPVAGSNVGYGGPTSDNTFTLSFYYGGSIGAGAGQISPTSSYIELIFSTNSDGATHPDFYFDNARLVTAVPEPASVVLAGLGSLMLIGIGRRCRRSSALIRA